VILRRFGSETIVLNLETGYYHGLNRDAAEMLEAMTDARTLGEAAARLAEERGIDPDGARNAVCRLFWDLDDRGLIAAAGFGA